MSWQTVRLGDIATFSNGVNFGKEAYGAGVKLIGVSDFGDKYYPDYSTLSEVIPDVVHDRALLEPGDIVFVRSNGNKALVGRCMLLTDECESVTFSGFCIRARLNDTSRWSPRFFTYYFKSVGFRKSISSSTAGTNIQNLNQGILSSHTAQVPDFETQCRIADILDQYSNLIENNRRQIALLEEAAQRLYREWFVDLRFPGHEGVEIVDELPDGWLRMPISEYAHVIKGCSYKTENIDVEQGVPMVNLASIASWGGYKPYTERTYGGAYKAEQVLGANDVVMALTEQTAGLAGYVARIPRYAQGSIPSMDLACLRPKSGTCAYLYCTCRFGDVSRLLSPLANGTKIKHLKPEALGYTDMPVPPMELQQKFEDTVNPTFGCIDVLMEQNERLRVARDHLLPKLMSGEIEVEG